MDLESTRSKETNVLKLKGDWTIERAGELKAALLEVLNGGEHILIDTEELTDTDLCAVQLLCAAHRASVRLGKHLELNEQRPEALKRIVRDAGLVRTIGCHKDPNIDCLWTGDWTP